MQCFSIILFFPGASAPAALVPGIRPVRVGFSLRRFDIGRFRGGRGFVPIGIAGVKVVGAYVRKDHPWALDYWDSVGFKIDERFVIFMHRM